MRILTNIAAFPREWRTEGRVTGTARTANTLDEFTRQLDDVDLLLINGNPDLVLGLCRHFVTRPRRRRPLICVDIVLRAPAPGLVPAAKTFVKRLLLSRVDHFVHYFKDLRGYARYFGITPQRSSFVPFKPNLRYRHEGVPRADGRYVLCFGRSLRDYDTFFRAAELFPYPAAIPRPDFVELARHGSRFTRRIEDLPPNVELLDDDGGQDALIRILEGAHIVVLPIIKESILSGISTYLNSMLLGKCVIMSEGPGGPDVLTDQALFVPPEDPPALAAMVRRVWEDDRLRHDTAAKGHAYAMSLGGEPELYQRILEQSIGWMQSQRLV
jgi:glycosyltransferase involved in cell wall biosynthesis